ncbi:hypothetical protein [Pantoea dispersa]|uniref:hypothetical protein n=1 Tax=Pantoea dispersa TaxID=59814 RepID=UPI002420306A|nr:hypothetical protein [Pantoea dispersa]
MRASVQSAQKSPRKIQIALTSPPVGFAVELPEGIEANNYLTFLAARISSDLETFKANQVTPQFATITLINSEDTMPGEDMSERIAKIEQRLDHLSAAIDSVNAKLDRVLETATDTKTVNTVIMDKFVEYDKKLDKKPSKDEVEKLIAQGTNKQIYWTIGTLLVLAGILYKLLQP